MSEPDRGRSSRNSTSDRRATSAKKKVQWASDVRKADERKPRSQSAIPYDQMLLKLSRATEVLERSQTLEEDFEKALSEIQERLADGASPNTDDEPIPNKECRSNTR